MNQHDMSNTGGRIVEFDENSFLFTTGDGQLYAEAQNSDSMWGKLLKINYNGNLEKIVAKGMRYSRSSLLCERQSCCYV